MGDVNPELESFREQWLREVKAGTSADKRPYKASTTAGASSSKQTPKKTFEPHLPPPAPTSVAEDDRNLEEVEPKAYHDLENKHLAFQLGERSSTHVRRGSTDGLPRSALEHYERAVEKESQGSLGESLSLYRQAFRMDASVDKSYKNKHFPPSSFHRQLNPSNAPATVPNPAHHSFPGLQPSMSQLISEFAGLTIPPAPEAIEGTPPPPCPIASLPSEILIEVLLHSAIADVASFARMAQVCKRFAYLVTTEERIWKRVCCGSQFGFGAMHYDYACSILGEPLDEDKGHYLNDNPEQTEETEPTLPGQSRTEPTPLTLSLLQTTYLSSWRRMFHTRPRLRFSGVYISTVNYVRPGAASATQAAWNTPVHIVTYYRYLRFFRDGTVLSLLTVADPVDVVHHLTKENVALHSTGAAGALPSAVVKNALRGRWRLSDPSNTSGGDRELEPEGDVHIETEGVGEKYIYKMHISIRSASSSSRKLRGNKLVWKGFWSYNRLTDDWAEFGLRNDRPFFWSRVKSYGV